MITAILLTLLTILLSLAIYDRRRRLSVLKRNGIDGPTPNFIFGCFNEFILSNVPVLNRWYKQYGRVFGYYIGSKPVVVVSDLELLRKVFIKDFNLFSERQMFVKGGLHAEEEREVSLVSNPTGCKRWKEQRSMMTTSFTSYRMKAMVPILDGAIDPFIEKINNLSNHDQEFDIYGMFQALTMDTIGRAAFGVQTSVQTDPDNDEFLKAAKKLFDANFDFFTFLPLMSNMLFREYEKIIYPIRHYQWKIMNFFGYKDHVTLLREVVRSVIEKRRADGLTGRKDLLQSMLDAKVLRSDVKDMNYENLTATSEDKIEVKKDTNTTSDETSGQGDTKNVLKLTDEEILANSILCFEAAFETTSTLLGYLSYVLVKYPEVQESIREEVKQVKAKDGTFNYNTMTSMPYLGAVLYETMRMYPPVTMFVARIATVDYVYTIDDKTITIPKGADVQAPVYQVQHDPEFWTDPEKFDPDRFLNGTHDPMAFQAFGLGPKNCLGMRFALLEAKIAVARLLDNFKLVPGTKMDFTKPIEVTYKPITMTPKGGVFVKAIKINDE